MLKLKDIFNIDISSKGGSKLYKKIMRKYNIPLKDVKEVKQEIVECSSGDGEGVKEYYYRFKDEYLNTNIYDITIEETTVIEFLQIFCGIDTIICPIDDNDIVKYAEVNSYFVLINKLKITPYFKIIDSNSFTAVSYPDDKTIPSDAIIRRKGNISDRIKNSHSGNEEEINYIIELINTYIQEITKEEYESMITYKP